jgi:hypothetical protein
MHHLENFSFAKRAPMQLISEPEFVPNIEGAQLRCLSFLKAKTNKNEIIIRGYKY